MPAVIFGDRFRYLGEPAWHGIGEPIPEDADMTAVETFDFADILYNVYKTPIYATVNGDSIRVPNQYAIVREATEDSEPTFFTVVGQEFQPVQNLAIAQAIDASGLLKDYRIETVGALGNGETMFTAMAERDGDFEIAGTPVKSYWTVYDGKDGNRALGLMWTPVKTVCSNTLVMALKASTINVKIQHTERAEMDLDFWLSLAPKLSAAKERSQAVINQMVKTEIDEDGMVEMLSAAYPVPKASGKVQLRDWNLVLADDQQIHVDKAIAAHERNAIRQMEKMTLAKEVFEAYGDTSDERALAGTVWGLYEAIVDVEDHRESSRESENIFASAMFGQRARSKREAFKVGMKLAGVKD